VLSSYLVNKDECRSTTVALVALSGDGKYLTSWESTTGTTDLDFQINSNLECAVVVCDRVT
jgi:hypothetical protein